MDTGADVQVQAYDWDDVLGGFFLAPGVPTNREVKKDVSRQKKKKNNNKKKKINKENELVPEVYRQKFRNLVKRRGKTRL